MLSEFTFSSAAFVCCVAQRPIQDWGGGQTPDRHLLVVRAPQRVADLLDPAKDRHAVEQVGKTQGCQLALTLQDHFQASGRYLNKSSVCSTHIACEKETRSMLSGTQAGFPLIITGLSTSGSLAAAEMHSSPGLVPGTDRPSQASGIFLHCAPGQGCTNHSPSPGNFPACCGRMGGCRVLWSPRLPAAACLSPLPLAMHQTARACTVPLSPGPKIFPIIHITPYSMG